ncbi:UNVERIFIED_CONTAM: hypothetical protein Slati_4263500 [Sesamum latifolium]|uniref:Transposase MuDR plant domain-containing protein n=1 Tax=Sesamum latifolium TaxID=2727402 RepID=A0AAW2TC68_9LAMI
MVMIRTDRYLKMPPPAYHLKSQTITVAFFYGGELRNLPVATCIGGKVKKFDYEVAVNAGEEERSVHNTENRKGKGKIDGKAKGKAKKKLNFAEDIEYLGTDMEFLGENINVNENVDVVEPSRDNPGVDEPSRGGDVGVDEPDIEKDESDSGFLENDYDMNNDNSEDDGELYKEYVNETENENGKQSETSSESDSDDVVISEADMDEHRMSDDDDKGPEPAVFNLIEIYDPSLELGMIFTSKTEFKKRDNEFTFMSDKQKGLIQAFLVVFPNSAHRFCVRHLHNNMKTVGFRGLAYKNALWKAARASTVGEFKLRMEEIKSLDQAAFDWLQDKPAQAWSKSHFTEQPKCDILLNNYCESFNENILDARDKPVLTLLEWIREYLMRRLQENRDKAARKWKVSILWIWKEEHALVEFGNFRHSIEPAILSISGELLWSETLFIPPLPPNFGRGPGRPAGARRREPDEKPVMDKKRNGKKPVKQVKLKRQHVSHHCRICGEADHKRGESKGYPKPRKHSIYVDPHRESVTASETVANVNPVILPPENPQEDTSQENEPTQTILTEFSPAITPTSQPGPSMYEQLQMTHNNISMQPPVALQPRLSIRAPPPMTGTAFMPSFSTRPAIPVPKNIIKMGGQKFVNLSTWPSSQTDGDARNT